MEFEFFPYIGIGDIRLTAKIKEVETSLKMEADKRKQEWEGTISYTGYFEPYDMMVSWTDEEEGLDVIEFFADPEEAVALNFNGQDLRALSYEELLVEFRKYDEEVIEGVTGIYSLKLGIGAGMPASDDEKLPESLILFRKGYYDGTDLSMT